MTNNLQIYLDYIFSFYKGYQVGQGGFFTRNWSFDKNTDLEFKNHILDVANALAQNDIIICETSRSEMPFVRLAQKGYDYLQGGDLELGKLSIAEHIDLSQPTDKIYNRLWDFIGNEKTAPFYLKGPDYFNTIAPYIGLSSYTYSQYIQQLKNANKSTSRISWFRELFHALRREDIQAFLNDLSRKIIDVYQPLYRAPIDDTDDPDIDWTDISIASTLPPSAVPPAIIATPVKKKVIFISYTWETRITPGHKEWVRALADRLKVEGFDVRLDQYQPLGTEMNHFMAKSVKEADRILLICTPTFKQKSDELIDGGGFEASLISNKLIKDITSTKFLPIVRIGTPEESMPDYLGNRNALVWHAGDDDDQLFKTLIDDLKQN